MTSDYNRWTRSRRGMQRFDVAHTRTCTTGGFEHVGLDDDGSHRMDYLGIDTFGVFYSEEAGDAGTVRVMMVRSKYSSLIPLTLTPAMAIFHWSWCATASFLGRLTATNLRRC
jgi:aspartokinase-like uncharacterized kinase